MAAAKISGQECKNKDLDKQHAKTVKTKAAIQKAFIALIEQRPFRDISVTDISREAKINRGTFYIHYLDKYDLLEKLRAETLDDIKASLDAIITEPHDCPPQKESRGSHKQTLISYAAILNALASVEEKRELLTALISDQGDPSFVLEVREYLKEKISSAVPLAGHASPENKKTIREDYLDIIVYDEILGVIIQWLKTGSKESPDEIAKLITETRFLSPSELLSSYTVVSAH